MRVISPKFSYQKPVPKPVTSMKRERHSWAAVNLILKQGPEISDLNTSLEGSL